MIELTHAYLAWKLVTFGFVFGVFVGLAVAVGIVAYRLK